MTLVTVMSWSNGHIFGTQGSDPVEEKALETALRLLGAKYGFSFRSEAVPDTSTAWRLSAISNWPDNFSYQQFFDEIGELVDGNPYGLHLTRSNFTLLWGFGFVVPSEPDLRIANQTAKLIRGTMEMFDILVTDEEVKVVYQPGELIVFYTKDKFDLERWVKLLGALVQAHKALIV